MKEEYLIKFDTCLPHHFRDGKQKIETASNEYEASFRILSDVISSEFNPNMSKSYKIGIDRKNIKEISFIKNEYDLCSCLIKDKDGNIIYEINAVSYEIYEYAPSDIRGMEW